MQFILDDKVGWGVVGAQTEQLSRPRLARKLGVFVGGADHQGGQAVIDQIVHCYHRQGRARKAAPRAAAGHLQVGLGIIRRPMQQAIALRATCQAARI